MENFPSPDNFEWTSVAQKSTNTFFPKNDIPLSHWSYPTIIPAIYLILVVASNSRLRENVEPIVSKSVLNPVCTIHNIILLNSNSDELVLYEPVSMLSTSFPIVYVMKGKGQ